MPLDLSIDNRDITRALNLLCDKVLAINRFIENNPLLSNDCIHALDTKILGAGPLIRILYYLLVGDHRLPVETIRMVINETTNYPSLSELIDSLEDLCSENISSNATSPNHLEIIGIESRTLFYGSSE